MCDNGGGHARMPLMVVANALLTPNICVVSVVANPHGSADIAISQDAAPMPHPRVHGCPQGIAVRHVNCGRWKLNRRRKRHCGQDQTAAIYPPCCHRSPRRTSRHPDRSESAGPRTYPGRAVIAGNVTDCEPRPPQPRNACQQTASESCLVQQRRGTGATTRSRSGAAVLESAVQRHGAPT